MRSEVTLTLYMDGGEPHRVVMRSKIFTLGRSDENDIVIDDPDISRRHAVIENYGGAVQISDCGSQNGTYLNGELISGAVELQDGDRISLGDLYDIDVEIRQMAVRSATMRGADARSRPRPPVAYGGRTQGHGAAAQASSFPSWGAPVLIAVAAIVMILLVAGLVLTLSRRTSVSSLPSDPGGSTINSSNNPANAGTTPRGVTTAGGGGGGGSSNGNSPGVATTAGAVDERRIEDLALRVMSRLAGDSPTIPERGVRDVARKVTQFSGSASVAEKLRAVSRDMADISSQARQSGFPEPALIIYAVLAEMEQTRNSNASAVAREILPQMNVLRVTIGANTVNSSLLCVAAYKYPPFRPPPGSIAQHPIIIEALQLGRRTNRPDARNVWFMREHNVLNENAYDFVVTFLALGVISQRPSDFGIQSSPLIF